MIKKLRSLTIASFFVFLALAVNTTPYVYAAGGPQNDNLEDAFSIIEAASTDEDGGNVARAVEKYIKAFNILEAIKKEYPENKRAGLLIDLVKAKVRECRTKLEETLSAIDEKILSGEQKRPSPPEYRNESSEEQIMPTKESQKHRAKAEEYRAKAEEARARAEGHRAKAEEHRARAEGHIAKAQEYRAKAEEERAKGEEYRVKPSPRREEVVRRIPRRVERIPRRVERRPKRVIYGARPGEYVGALVGKGIKGAIYHGRSMLSELRDFGTGVAACLKKEFESFKRKKPAKPIVEAAKRPAIEEKPLVEERPAVEEKPLIEERPAIEEKPLVEEKPAIEEKPLVEEKPSVKMLEEGKKEWVVAKAKEEVGYDFTGYAADSALKFSYKGETFTLDKPSLRKGDDMWAPVGPLLEKLEVMFFKIDAQNFGIVRGDGMPFELKVGDLAVRFNKIPYFSLERPPALYEGDFMLSLESLAKTLDINYTYNASTNTVEFSEAELEEFSTFTMPKPPEVIEKKKEEPKVLPQEPTDIREEFLPSKYSRDVDLKLDTTASYLLDKFAHDRTRQAEWLLRGKAYGYNVDGRFRMRDIRSSEKQRFKEDGEYIGFYKDDISFKFLDNFYTIPYLRSQSAQYFGAEAAKRYGQFKTTAIYGWTDNTVSGPASVGAVRFYGDLYSLRQEYATPSKNFTTGVTLLYNENSAEHQVKSGTTDYPRRNFVMITDNIVSPYKDLKLRYSHALSNYVPDNYVNKRFVDDDWKAGVDFTQERYSVKVNYERVGGQYASIGIPSTYRDYEGTDFSTNFIFAKNWSTNIGGKLSKNNVDRNPRVQTTFGKTLYTSTALGLPWDQSLNAGWTIDETTTKGGDQDLSGNTYKDLRLDYVKVWKNLTAQFSFDHYTLDAFATATGGSVTDSYSMSLFNFLPELNNSYIRYYQNYRKTKTLTANSYTTEYLDTDLNGRLNITDYLSANAGWKVAYTRREAFTDTALMTLTVGGEFKSSPVTTFNTDFTLSNFDLYQRKTFLPKHYTVLFKGRHLFDIATPEKWGKVGAFIYRDLNSNGRFDPGEPNVPNVRVYIVNGRAAYTNDKGYAIIQKVVPGERQAKVDMTKFPIDLYVRGPAVKAVSVEPFKVSKVDFPVVKTGSIKGRVFIDKDSDGIFDKIVDEPLPNARIYLAPDLKDTLTFSDGTYAFDYAYPGDYNVCIDLRSIPTGSKLTSQEKLSLSLQEEARLTGLDFLLSPKPIEIEYFGRE